METVLPTPVFARRNVAYACATLCCLLWGSSYPAIKNGYELFQIATDDIPSKVVFAGYRFLFAGCCCSSLHWHSANPSPD
jgi:drug/metabolite transporter (DMT)-like permease